MKEVESSLFVHSRALYIENLKINTNKQANKNMLELTNLVKLQDTNLVGFFTLWEPTTQLPNKYTETYSYLGRPGLSLAYF